MELDIMIIKGALKIYGRHLRGFEEDDRSHIHQEMLTRVEELMTKPVEKKEKSLTIWLD